jgi:hypothetical protein
MHNETRVTERSTGNINEANLVFAEDFTSNALLQVRVYWDASKAVKVHEKPFLVLVSAAPQAPAGNAGGKTYLLERPYGVSMKFSVEELAAMGFALDRIASGAAEHYGMDNTWTKWADPAKAKNGNGGIGKKMLRVAPVLKNNDQTKKTVNLGFWCVLDAATPDPRAMLKNCKRDAQGIKYGVTVNLNAYQAMAVAMNLLSLADKLTDLDRQHRVKRFREMSGPARRDAGARPRNVDDAEAGQGGGNRVMRLHSNDRAEDPVRESAAAPAAAHNGDGVHNAGRQTLGGCTPRYVSQGATQGGSRSSSPAPTAPLPASRQPALYGARNTDFAPRPARRVTP